MPYKYCQHVKENGIFCQAAAVRGRQYCYYHARSRARQLALAKAAAEKKSWRVNIPPLEDLHAVQVALQQVTEALAAGAIEEKRASLMLRALQQAGVNLRQRPIWPKWSAYEVSEDTDFRVVEYPGLEAEFDLPRRIDLAMPPDILFPPPEAERPTRLVSPLQSSDASQATGDESRAATSAERDNAGQPPKKQPGTVKPKSQDKKESAAGSC